MENVPTYAVLLNAALNNLAPAFAVGEDHIHTAPYRYFNGAATRPGHPVIAHHYRHVNFILINADDAASLTSVQDAEDYIQSTRWAVGYFGRMGETFYAPLSANTGLTTVDISAATTMLHMWKCANWAWMSGPSYAPSPNSCEDCKHHGVCPFDQSMPKDERPSWHSLPHAGVKEIDELTKAVINKIREFGFSEDDWHVYAAPASTRQGNVEITPMTLSEKATIDVYYPEEWVNALLYEGKMPDDFLGNLAHKLPLVTYTLGIGEWATHIPQTFSFADEAVEFWKKFPYFMKTCRWDILKSPSENETSSSDETVETVESTVTDKSFFYKLINSVFHRH